MLQPESADMSAGKVGDEIHINYWSVGSMSSGALILCVLEMVKQLGDIWTIRGFTSKCVI